VRFQWDLVCKREYLKDLSQTILTVGVMIGAMAFTTLSDYFGRKFAFLFSQWAMVVVGVITAFVPNYYAFLVLRFCTGALQQVGLLTCVTFCSSADQKLPYSDLRPNKLPDNATEYQLQIRSRIG